MARAAKKNKYTCLNGPYKGQTLLLITPSTLTFTSGSFTGRYVGGHLQKRAIGCHPLDHAKLSDLDKQTPLFVKNSGKVDGGTTLVWQLKDGTTPCDPPPPPRVYEVGQKVKILQDVGEAPCSEYPGGTFAFKGDTVVIRELSFKSDHYNVSHEHITDGTTFRVKWDEVDHFVGVKVIDPLKGKTNGY